MAAALHGAAVPVRGEDDGVVEFAEPCVLDPGADPQAIIAGRATTPEAVEQRIRRVRYADLVVRVRDRGGRPVAGAAVDAEQVRHTFLFGCNAFLLQPGTDAPWQTGYRRRLTELFNYVTLPFYWGAYEPRPNHCQRDGWRRWLAGARTMVWK